MSTVIISVELNNQEQIFKFTTPPVNSSIQSQLQENLINLKVGITESNAYLYCLRDKSSKSFILDFSELELFLNKDNTKVGFEIVNCSELSQTICKVINNYILHYNTSFPSNYKLVKDICFYLINYFEYDVFAEEFISFLGVKLLSELVLLSSKGMRKYCLKAFKSLINYMNALEYIKSNQYVVDNIYKILVSADDSLTIIICLDILCKLCESMRKFAVLEIILADENISKYENYYKFEVIMSYMNEEYIVDIRILSLKLIVCLLKYIENPYEKSKLLLSLNKSSLYSKLDKLIHLKNEKIQEYLKDYQVISSYIIENSNFQKEILQQEISEYKEYINVLERKIENYYVNEELTKKTIEDLLEYKILFDNYKNNQEVFIDNNFHRNSSLIFSVEEFNTRREELIKGNKEIGLIFNSREVWENKYNLLKIDYQRMIDENKRICLQIEEKNKIISYLYEEIGCLKKENLYLKEKSELLMKNVSNQNSNIEKSITENEALSVNVNKPNENKDLTVQNEKIEKPEKTVLLKPIPLPPSIKINSNQAKFKLVSSMKFTYLSLIPNSIQKLKSISWNIINFKNQEMYNDSIWNQMEDRIFNINIQELYSLFENKTNTKRLSLLNENKVNLVLLIKKRFLSNKRSQSIGIILSKLPSINNLRRSLCLYNENDLLPDQVKILIKEFITNDEINQYKSILKDNENKEIQWEKEDQYLIDVYNLENSKIKLEIWYFNLLADEYISEIEYYFEIFNNCFESIEKLMSSLKVFLNYLLVIGNIMNNGSNRGLAYGFDIDVILKLNTIKDNRIKNSRSLVSYINSLIISNYLENFDSLLEVDRYLQGYSSIENLNKACKISISDIEKLITLLKKGNQANDKSISLLSIEEIVFVEKAKVKMKRIQDLIVEFEVRFQDINRKVIKIISVFGFINKEKYIATPDLFFGLLYNILLEVKKGIPIENEIRKLTERRFMIGKKVDNKTVVI